MVSCNVTPLARSNLMSTFSVITFQITHFIGIGTFGKMHYFVHHHERRTLMFGEFEASAQSEGSLIWP